ncbi:MAG: HAMP domain-containing methyl-accepting chemotaxis protein [Oscillospiraceae bacterium]|nr:HAMP domain-containing methyl-accepting chemotaxis protein [Oscillospiraceae bacterium]
MLKNLPIRIKMIAIYVCMVVFTIPALIIFCSIIAWLTNNLGTDSATIVNSARKIVSFAPWVCAVYVIVYAGVAYFIAHIIVKQTAIPMKKMSGLAKRLSEGDINVTFDHRAGDEVGQLAEELQLMVDSMRKQADALIVISQGDLTANVTARSDSDAVNKAISQMLDNNNRMMLEVRAAARQVANGAKQMATGAQSLAQGSTEQSASIEELSSSISEIARKTKDNMERADKAAELSDSIKDMAEKGSRQMSEMMAAVNEISNASSSINKVIKVIDDIAFQTNILALNAAVEAARAGQHGKGFAVVAEEVRNLAAKSAEAAKDSGSLIDNSIAKASLGVRIAGETAESLAEIVTGINESNQLVRDIARSSDEQSQDIQQINSGVDQVAQVVSHNSATAEEEAAASEEMSGQSTVLEQLISQFKLKDSGTRQTLPPAAETERKRFDIPSSSEYTYSGSDVGFGKY